MGHMSDLDIIRQDHGLPVTTPLEVLVRLSGNNGGIMSGYIPCACRDCMDIAIGEPGALCNECQDASCIPIVEWREPIQFASSYECQRDDAYGANGFEAFYPEVHDVP